jgi:hypothetical protein
MGSRNSQQKSQSAQAFAFYGSFSSACNRHVLTDGRLCARVDRADKRFGDYVAIKVR